MKNYYLLFIMIALILIGSCSNNDEIATNSNLGLLKTIENSYNGNIDYTSEIEYDEDQRISLLIINQGNFLTQIYNLKYTGRDLESITLIQQWHLQNIETTIIYAVENKNNEIILSPNNSENKIVFLITDGFIDSYKRYWGDNANYVDESVFTRDQNNNIKDISYYTTNEFDTDLLVWEYTFSNFDSSAKLNSAYNPVFNYSFSLYNPHIGFVLSLKISNETPLTSSFLNGNGNFHEENVKAQIVTQENELVKKLKYSYAVSPSSEYQLDLQYN